MATNKDSKKLKPSDKVTLSDKTKVVARLSTDQKTNYTRIGLAMCGIAVNNKTSELIWRLQEGMYKKGGEFALSDSVDIEVLIDKKYAVKSPSNKTVKAVPVKKESPIKVPSTVLPKIMVGDDEVRLNYWQKNALRKAIQEHGEKSKAVKVLMMDIASKSRPINKNGKGTRYSTAKVFQ